MKNSLKISCPTRLITKKIQAIELETEFCFFLRPGSVLVLEQCEIKNGDLVAIFANNEVFFGIYSEFCGVIGVETRPETIETFEQKDVEILGKVIGYCEQRQNELFMRDLS